ncbi:MAG: flippase-like domain-containing protein, partial [Deltaproteobacteria bacterium]|nr:flippase-like domain-containing protein [Deltaproteobacteria bacterium]
MKFFRPILFLIAILLAWTIIRHLGPAKIWGHIRMAGWGMSLVFLMGFPRFLLYTLGWKEFLPSGAYRLRKLYQIKIAGELITRSTPVHFVGGDTARVLLMGKNIPRKNQTGSVIIDRTVMTLGAAVMVLLGLLIASFRLPLPWLPKLALWLLVALLFWGLSFIISTQKKSAFVSLLNLVGKMGIEKWIPPAWRAKAGEMDEVIRGYYGEGHKKMIRALGFNCASRLLAAMEIYLILCF